MEEHLVGSLLKIRNKKVLLISINTHWGNNIRVPNFFYIFSNKDIVCSLYQNRSPTLVKMIEISFNISLGSLKPWCYFFFFFKKSTIKYYFSNLIGVSDPFDKWTNYFLIWEKIENEGSRCYYTNTLFDYQNDFC